MSYWDTGRPSDRLMEECAEVIHAICKAHRFGWKNHHPNTPEVNNIQLVLTEINHLERRIKEFKVWATTKGGE